ncbi:MAG: hypothetical protein HKP30_17195 [Myxococcales bacterium]|nr:hypothetical protein [Myxococcales bacterium]
MIRTFALASALVLAPLGLASTAHAFTIGAEVGISSLAPCPSFCGGSGATSGFTSDGGGGSSSAADILDDVRGYGEGEAGFDADLLPTLGALANAEPNARVGVGATAYRAYTHSGPATTMNLEVTLDGELSSAQVLDAQARAVVSVILGTDLPHSTDVGSFRFEILPGEEDLEELGFVDLSLDNNVGPHSKTGSISFDVADGDTYFIWANLTASGTRDGTADALDTLTMTFVPEPQAALLVVFGLAALAVRRR